MVLQWCCCGVTVVLQWCYSGDTVIFLRDKYGTDIVAYTSQVGGVTMVLQWCYNGVTMVLQWCYNGVTVVLQWCYSGVTVIFLRDKYGTDIVAYTSQVCMFVYMCVCVCVRESKSDKYSTDIVDYTSQVSCRLLSVDYCLLSAVCCLLTGVCWYRQVSTYMLTCDRFLLYSVPCTFESMRLHRPC
jgi:hypothetical protein